MITKWKLKNFKSISNLTELSFGPLTILAGANSSGKSTILQSILLISQTLASRVSSRSVVLNGPIVKLGQFNDLKSVSNNEDSILIGWEISAINNDNDKDRKLTQLGPIFSMEKQLKQINSEMSFTARSRSGVDRTEQLQPRLKYHTINWIDYREHEETSHKITVRRVTNKLKKMNKKDINTSDEKILNAVDFDVTMDSRTKDILSRASMRGYPSAEPIGIQLQHFLPEQILYKYKKSERTARQIAALICEEDPIFIDHLLLRVESEPQDFIFPQSVIDFLHEQFSKNNKQLNDPITQENLTIKEWSGLMRDMDRRTRTEIRKILKTKEVREIIFKKIKETLTEEYAFAFDRWPFFLMEVTRYIDDVFTTGIKYLGPLRDEPRPLYPLAPGNDPYDIGIKGEHTAAIFDLYKDHSITCIKPTLFASPQIEPEISTTTLRDAIMEWLKYLDVASNITTEDKGKIGHELKVIPKDSNKGQDLTHVGVGVSQVLPILVMCLLAKEDTTIIIEQPELHLHPKVQSLLADFFLSMALLGKQCIIETHSEYFLNRLRFRAAAAKGDRISSLLKIYFAEKKEGSSNFREVEVNKYGAIMDWPEGFFDQSQSEAEQILRNATKKIKAERDNKNG